MGRRIWILVIFLILAGRLDSQGRAQNFIPFEPQKSRSFQSNLIFCDTSGSLDVFDIESGIFTDHFKPLWQNGQLEKDHSYWIRFVMAENPLPGESLVRIQPRLRVADLYFRNDSGQMIVQKNGLSERFSERVIPDSDILFILPPDNSGRVFYLNVISDYDTGLGLINTSMTGYIAGKIDRTYAMGFFFGIGAIAFLFSLIFYSKLREKTYLFYSLYVLSFTIFAFVDMGLIVRIISNTGIPWHRDLYTIPFASMTLFLLFYARGLLETHKNPFLDTLIRFSIIARIIIYFAGTLFNLPALYSPYIDNLLLLSAFASSIVKLKQGYKPARYFLVGLSALYLGLIVHSVENIGVIPYNLVPFFSMYKTGIVEMIFFSLALADRFRIMKIEKDLDHKKTILYLRENSELKDKIIQQLNENEKLKDTVNRELEAKVKERTRDLQEANNIILEINRFLEESNNKLAQEVRKISINRVMQKTVTFDEFREIYPDDDSCYRFLENLKWSKGFVCKKCGNTRYSDGNTPYSRRCSKCNYIERITSDTLFSHSKFPITKAFYLLFLVNSGKNFTIEKLSDILDMRKQTVWYFRKKIEQTMSSRKGRKKITEEGWSRWII